MPATEQRLVELVVEYQPQTLILLGDVMDGGGAWKETVRVIERLRGLVPLLIFIEGNHDRKQLRSACSSQAWHRIGRFVFHHGHRFDAVWTEARFEFERPSEAIHVTGHEHPVAKCCDGQGAKHCIPIMIQQRLRGTAAAEHWILPAYSPWAGGAEYLGPHERLAVWSCEDEGVAKVA
jgi:uncharacterized protein